LKVPKNTVTSIILKWKKFGTTKTLPRAGRWSITWWSLWQSSRVPLWRWEKLPKGQLSLQHFTNQVFKLDWPDGSHSWVKGTWQPTRSLPKKQLKTPRPWERRFFGLMKPRLNSLAWMPRVKSGGNLAPSLQWNMVVVASYCGDVFQRQGLGD
jgi:hypothetical protein